MKAIQTRKHYETSLFVAEAKSEGTETTIWITDKNTGKTCSLEGAYIGELGVSQSIADELLEIEKAFGCWFED